jgi:hypothetical protein
MPEFSLQNLVLVKSIYSVGGGLNICTQCLSFKLKVSLLSSLFQDFNYCLFFPVFCVYLLQFVCQQKQFTFFRQPFCPRSLVCFYMFINLKLFRLHLDLKGQCHEIFLLQVFVIDNLPLSP